MHVADGALIAGPGSSVESRTDTIIALETELRARAIEPGTEGGTSMADALAPRFAAL